MNVLWPCSTYKLSLKENTWIYDLKPCHLQCAVIKQCCEKQWKDVTNRSISGDKFKWTTQTLWRIFTHLDDKPFPACIMEFILNVNVHTFGRYISTLFCLGLGVTFFFPHTWNAFQRPFRKCFRFCDTGFLFSVHDNSYVQMMTFSLFNYEECMIGWVVLVIAMSHGWHI